MEEGAQSPRFIIDVPTEAGIMTNYVRIAYLDVQMWVPVEVDVQAKPSVIKSFSKPDRTCLSAIAADLTEFYNQRLEELHINTYTPLINEFYWVKKSGYALSSLMAGAGGKAMAVLDKRDRSRIHLCSFPPIKARDQNPWIFKP